jgi:hypothetical protein
MRTGARKQYKIELCSVDTGRIIDYPPIDAQWFGTVDDLAYPFNAFLGAAHFTAVVKWYFLLAFGAGEFDEDPGFNVTESWRKELQSACDELIAAPQREQQREPNDRIKELEKKAEMLRHEITKKKEDDQTVEQQAREFKRIDTVLLQPKTRDKNGRHQRTTRKTDGRTRDLQDDKKPRIRRDKEYTDRRTTLPPPRPHRTNEAGIFSPGIETSAASPVPEISRITSLPPRPPRSCATSP